MADDYYELLRVPKDATAQDIKKAFRQIARECHPDVAGADPAAEERFRQAKSAYETLMDPVTRARYDRRGQRRQQLSVGGSSFFDAYYKQTAKSYEENPKQAQSTRRRVDRGNNLDLDDLFKDFSDVGFGNERREGGRAEPQQGEDVHIELDVPSTIAHSGGSVTAVYYRLQRADSWRPGSPDPGVVRIQDIADVRLSPDTRDGEMLRERGLGNAGSYGGPFGDLVVRVTIVAAGPGRSAAPVEAPSPRPPSPSPTARRASPPPLAPRNEAPQQGPQHVPDESLADPTEAPTQPAESPPPETPSAPATKTEEHILALSIAEAVLGGKVDLDLGTATVKVNIPPGTSSGWKLRLKRKGGEKGGPEEIVAVVQIIVPKDVDEESRQLIEQFGRLNPVPRRPGDRG